MRTGVALATRYYARVTDRVDTVCRECRRMGSGTVFLRAWSTAGVLPLATLLSACAPSMVEGFDSPEPAARNVAIVRAVDQPPDHATDAALVDMLRSDDPVTRLLAISVLERRTGQRLGYDPSSDAEARAAAVAEWDRWVAQPTDSRHVPEAR